MEFFETVLFNNTVYMWLLAAFVSLFVFLLAQLLKKMLLRRMIDNTNENTSAIFDLLSQLSLRTHGFFILMAAIFLGSLMVQLPAAVHNVIRILTITIFLIQSGFWLNNMIDHWIKQRVRKELERENSSATALHGVGLVVKIVLWLILVLLILENITGINVTTLIASLGITGVAVALAVQNILSDLFASLSITLDRPFVIGDSIVVGEFIGEVEHIGLKSTRIRSLTGEQLIFSNSDLLNSRIRNYKRMDRRRVVFTLGLTYDTPAEKIEKIPDLLKEIISDLPQISFDRAHFKAFLDFSLSIEVVYFVENPNYLLYMDTQQAINLAILRRFAQEGIEFAFPTQSVYVSGTIG